MDIHSSKQILAADDLYTLQDSFCCSGTPFQYRLTTGEIGWADFIRGKYSIVDWLDENTDNGLLTFDDAEAMSKVLDDDCEGFGKAVMLSDETALQKLFFWMYGENHEN